MSFLGQVSARFTLLLTLIDTFAYFTLHSALFRRKDPSMLPGLFLGKLGEGFITSRLACRYFEFILFAANPGHTWHAEFVSNYIHLRTYARALHLLYRC